MNVCLIGAKSLQYTVSNDLVYCMYCIFYLVSS